MECQQGFERCSSGNPKFLEEIPFRKIAMKKLGAVTLIKWNGSISFPWLVKTISIYHNFPVSREKNNALSSFWPCSGLDLISKLILLPNFSSTCNEQHEGSRVDHQPSWTSFGISSKASRKQQPWIQHGFVQKTFHYWSWNHGNIWWKYTATPKPYSPLLYSQLLYSQILYLPPKFPWGRSSIGRGYVKLHF